MSTINHLGTLTQIHSQDDSVTVKTVQDVEPLLDHNKYLRSLPQKSDWGRHVASIPNVIYLKWWDEEYAKGNVNLQLYSKEMNDIVERKLKDPDWAYLRTDCRANDLRTGWDGA